MVLYPLLHISPCTPMGHSSPVSGSITFTSVNSKSRPTVLQRTSNESSMREAVMPGEASVSPYTLVTFINIFSSTRFISSTGQSEPAIMPVRRLDISNISNMGWFSSAMNMVGTPYKAVQRSLWTEASTSSGSKRSTITCVHPCVRQFMVANTTPKQWNRGTQTHSLSSEVNFMCSPVRKPLLLML